MKTLVVEKDGSCRVGEIERPRYDEYGALVKVLACGLCGTDKKILHGTFKGFHSYPCLLGHEAVGEVVEVGARVKNLKPGDRVIAPYVDEAPAGYATIFGGFSQYAIAHDWRAMDADGVSRKDPKFLDYYPIQKTLPADLDPAAGVMIVTLREVLAASRHFGFAHDKSIVIFGCGAVGLSFAKIGRLLGLDPIIMCDVLDEKAQDAARVGADYFINSATQDVVAKVREICPGGVDYTLDAVGINGLINTSMELIKSCGEILVYGISPKLSMQIDWGNAPYNWNLRFLQYPEKEEESAAHEQVVRWVQIGALDPLDFVTNVFDYADILKAVDLLQSGKPAGKIVVRMA